MSDLSPRSPPSPRPSNVDGDRPWRRAAALLLAGFLLLAFTAPVAVAEDEEDEKGPGKRSEKSNGPAKGKDKEKDDRDDDEDERGERADGHSKPRKPGKLSEQDGVFKGRYVAFSLDLENCTVLDYKLYNVSLLASIDFEGSCEVEDRKGGHVLRVDGDDVEFRIHDAPNGLLRFESDDAPFTLMLASGVTANQSGKKVEFSAASNLSGVLKFDEDANVTLAGSQLQVDEGSGSLWAHPLSGGSPARVEIREAMKKGRVGGEVDVLVADGAITTEVLQYDNVTIKVTKKSSSVFRILVDANLTEGRTFVLNMPPGLFEKDRVGVRYYDADADGFFTESNITKADGLDDVLSIEAGEGPEYWVVKDDAGKHVLVAVPSFSVHAFEVMSLGVTVMPSILVGAALAVGVVAVAAVAMFAPRRRA